MSYVFEHNKKKIELPDFKDLPIGLVRKSRKLPEEEQTWFILEELLDAKTMDLVDGMSVKEFTEMMSRWTQGAQLGE